MRKWVIRIMVGLAALYGIWCFLVVQEAPNQSYPRHPAPFEDARFSDARFTAPDGAEIPVALHLREGAPLVMYFMGNAGSRALFADDLDMLLDQPVSLAVMAYRGGEGSDLPPSETALKSDARALYRQLPELLGYAPQDIHAVGYSMGSGLALDLAAHEDLSSVILLAPMARICAMVGRMTLTPYCWLPGAERWDNLAAAAQVSEPVLQIYGTADTMFPPKDQQALAGRFPSPPVMVSLPLGHNDLPGQSRDAVEAWLSGGWR